MLSRSRVLGVLSVAAMLMGGLAIAQDVQTKTATPPADAKADTKSAEKARPQTSLKTAPKASDTSATPPTTVLPADPKTRSKTSKASYMDK